MISHGLLLLLPSSHQDVIVTMPRAHECLRIERLCHLLRSLRGGLEDRELGLSLGHSLTLLLPTHFVVECYVGIGYAYVVIATIGGGGVLLAMDSSIV